MVVSADERPANKASNPGHPPAASYENAHLLSQWLSQQDEAAQVELAESLFVELLQSASRVQAAEPGKACQKLCGFVQQCLKSPNAPIRQWAYGQDVSTRLFEYYLEWYENDPQRSMRLVPEVLVITLSRNPDPGTKSLLKDRVLKTLVSVVARQSTKFMIKSALQLFSQFLAKRVITAPDIAEAYRALEPSVRDVSELQLWQTLVQQLLAWMELSYVGPSIGKSANLIFGVLKDPQVPVPGFTIAEWQRWLQDAITQRPAILEDVKHYILMPLFQYEKPSSLVFLQNIQSAEIPESSEGREGVDSDLLFRLSALELGKKAGLVDEPREASQPTEATKKIALRSDLLASLLVHPSSSVRSCAFSLLVSSPASTSPLSSVALKLLKTHLAPFYADYEAKFRQEVQSYSKKLIRRLKNVINTAQRGVQRQAGDDSQPAKAGQIKYGPEAKLKSGEEAQVVLEMHMSFLEWLMSFLKEQLVPTASYQRHISGLKSLISAIKVPKQEVAVSDEIVDQQIVAVIATDPTWMRLLFDLLLDPFDDVRETAAAVLALLPTDIVGAPQEGSVGPTTLFASLREYAARAHTLATQTGRADHGDGTARSQGLLCSWSATQEAKFSVLSSALDRLEEKLAKAEADLGHAAIENPVHGDFASICYIWQVLLQDKYSDAVVEKLQQYQRRIMALCQRVWSTVRHVLCDDSPEGHLPEELEDIEGLDTKDLLSYSFRAVHESSNLMRLLVGPLRGGPDAGNILPALDVFKEVGNLACEQLSNLRHRGAFSTVSMTFSTCCQLSKNFKTSSSGTSAAEDLLRTWYSGALSCIMNQASTTRRSAGIPALTSGILSANAESPSFREVFMELEEIAKKPASVTETDGSNLPQVHALNCLRDAFRSSLLSKKCEAYLPETLRLAAGHLRSEVWAIRNCGLLLLRSLIDVLLGSTDSKAQLEAGWDGHTVRISYVKYHTLPGVLLELLKTAEADLGKLSQSSTAEAVFPALDIIRRAGPPEENRDELRRLIEAYLGSHIWHVREIAARTLCSFYIRGEWIDAAERLLQESGNKSNKLHGALLAIKFLVQRKMELGETITPEQWARLIDALHCHACPRPAFQAWPEIHAAYLEIINTAFSMSSALVSHSPGQLQNCATARASALLESEVAASVVHTAVHTGDLSMLEDHLFRTLNSDVNTACRMLEMISNSWQLNKAQTEVEGLVAVQSSLCSLYLRVCKQTAAPEARALALLGLASTLRDLIRINQLAQLPAKHEFREMWQSIQAGPMPPALSYAVLVASGPIMVVLITQEARDVKEVALPLRGWGVLLSSALDVDETFDTRFAAVSSLQSFVRGLRHQPTSSVSLPFLSALYDGLNDDDEDIRDVAADCAAILLGKSRTPLEAAEALLTWLRDTFQGSVEFRSCVVSRMTGNSHQFDATTFALAAPDAQFQKAMDFDDSLFATEEQNLFIDELREARRWCRVMDTLAYGHDEHALKQLERWTEVGLGHMAQLVVKDDGPLGWASDQHVFALCARILLCARSVVRATGAPAVQALLQEVKSAGQGSRLHGSLLALLGDLDVVGDTAV